MMRRPAPALSVLVVASVGAAFVSGCTAANQTAGTISGTAEPCIGPASPNGHYIEELVKVTQHSRTVATRRNLTSPYKFTFRLPPGLYRVSATSDGSVRIHVTAGQTTTVALHNSCI